MERFGLDWSDDGEVSSDIVVKLGGLLSKASLTAKRGSTYSAARLPYCTTELGRHNDREAPSDTEGSAMFLFDATKYGPAVANLLAEDRLSELGPGKPNKSAFGSLQWLTADDVVPHASSDQMVACCVSGLWLWHDYLDESHELSQDLGSPEGSYWHGIMHRREPDYSNAKYWYRRVGDHPIFDPLAESVAELSAGFELDEPAQELAGTWDPYAFVDLCAEVARGRSNSKEFCQHVARLEWQLLFDHCYDLAK